MLAKKIIDFITTTNHNVLPKKVVKFTRIFILDTIGACLDGIEMFVNSKQSIYLERFENTRLRKKATVIGTRHLDSRLFLYFLNIITRLLWLSYVHASQAKQFL